MRECTFVPAYHSLHGKPEHSQSHNTAERLLNWQKERDQKVLRIAIHQEEKTAIPLKSNCEAPSLVKIQEASERLNR